ncbi:MarR family transcriptional regulator [Flavobacterium sp. ASW18X]|nr:MarR family transcriptional regulator [Flavobacterium sp. ASW18X]
MTPLDLVILLKIASYKDVSWFQQDLASELGISQSEVSKSLNRSKYAGLLLPNGKNILPMAFLEFLRYGLPYVFPVKPGPVVRGLPTSHSAKPLSDDIQSSEAYVWPYGKGTVRGHSIVPLYPTVPEAALKDENLYELLALVDALRVGRAREKELAIKALKHHLALGE